MKGTSMATKNTPVTVLEEWKTILGERVEVDDDSAWRDLWFVTAEDGARYVLKRLGPWRNLPVADEARILRHVAIQGVTVRPSVMVVCHPGEDEPSLTVRIGCGRRLSCLTMRPGGSSGSHAPGWLHHFPVRLF